MEADDESIENEFIRVEVNGALLNIYDKQQECWYRNLNLLVEEADAGDAWDFSTPWTPGVVVKSTSSHFTSRIVEHGVVRSAIEITGELSVPASLEGDIRSERRVIIPVIFTVSVYNGFARVDVKLTIDNTAKDHRIRLQFSPGIKSEFVRLQSALAILDRQVERPKPSEEWFQQITQILPFREWLAIQDDTRGLALAVKGMYDYEATNNPVTGRPDISITLLRGIELMGRLNIMHRSGLASYAHHTPQAQCTGMQRFEWCYIPYSASDVEAAPFLPTAHSFLYPPVSHAIRSAQKDVESTAIPSLFCWDALNIQFSAYKKCYDRDGDILRIYENQGKETCVKIHINTNAYKRAFLSDMNEQTGEELQISDNSFTLKVKAYKAITIKLV